jgi:hypothetical protein
VTAPDLSRIRVCEARCSTCIFSPDSPITSERRQDYIQLWQERETFQVCHHGSITDDHWLMCRGFYDWCKTVGWEPLAITLGEALNRLDFVPAPELPEGAP